MLEGKQSDHHMEALECVFDAREREENLTPQ